MNKHEGKLKREKIGKPHGKETRTYKNWIKISQLFKEIEEGKKVKVGKNERKKEERNSLG